MLAHPQWPGGTCTCPRLEADVGHLGYAAVFILFVIRDFCASAPLLWLKMCDDSD